MKANRKYLVAVALLAVLSVVFGLAGTAVPMSRMVLPKQSSSSSSDVVTHFTNPPTYDSDWVNITDKLGQSFTLTHDLNTTEALVDVVGKQGLTDGDHKLFFGTTTYIQGFNQTYGGPSEDYAYSVVQTSDGGYAMAGASGWDFWLVKTDADGNALWNQTYGGGSIDEAWSVVQTFDGGYAIAGYTWSFGIGGDFWLVKTDAAGNMQWNQTYGGTSPDTAYSVVQTVDGGYAIAGVTSSFGAGWFDFWLVKTDSAGSELWSQTYGGADEDWAFSVVQTSNGGYALAGHTDSYGAGGYDFWLVKTDADGNALWNQTYGGGSIDEAWSVVQTVDGGYAIAGSGFANLVKTDVNGNQQWNKTYGGTAYSVVETVDGGYALAGAKTGDFWLVKTDAAGDMLWNKTCGGADPDIAYSVVQTVDRGYAMAGSTSSFDAGGEDLWLVKTDGEFGFSMGLSMTDFTNSTITFYRGSADPFWNYVRVRIWTIEEPTWQFGDINQDGVVDARDLAIIGQNYGKTFSALSLGGIIAVAALYTYKKRKQPK